MDKLYIRIYSLRERYFSLQINFEELTHALVQEKDLCSSRMLGFFSRGIQVFFRRTNIYLSAVEERGRILENFLSKANTRSSYIC